MNHRSPLLSIAVRSLRVLLIGLIALGMAAQETPILASDAGRDHVGSTPGHSACANCYPPPDGPTKYELPKCKCGSYKNGGTEVTPGATLCTSIIDATIFRFTAVGIDYGSAADGQPHGCGTGAGGQSGGCGSCGASAPTEPGHGHLPGLRIARLHRPDAGAGSFGPGVFSQYDVWMNALHSLPGRGDVLFLHDPTLYTDQQFDLAADGTFRTSNDAMHALQLYDGQGDVVTNFDDAKRVRAVFHTGLEYHLEVCGTGLRSRLVRVQDQNGNGTTIAYQHAADSGVGWAAMQKMASITDAYGRVATIQYAPATVAGRYVIQSIGLPNGGALTYHYDDPLLLGLSRVGYPDGTASTFTQRLDPASQTVVYSMMDIADDGGNGRREVYLSTPTWTDPATGAVSNQSANRARMETNAAGEISFLGWHEVDPASSVHLFSYVYKGGGAMYRHESYHGAPVSLWRATAWDLDRPVATWTWEAVHTYTTDSQGRLLGIRSPDGRAETYVRDAVTHQRAQVTQADGAVTSTTYSAWGSPLRQVDALGRVTEMTYDAADNLLARTVGAGTPEAATTTWVYNGRGQVVEERDPAYDPARPHEHATTYGYDAAGFLVGVALPADVDGGSRPAWAYAYDAAGRRIGATDPEGRVTAFAYDVRDRLVRTTYADGTYEETTYGAGAQAGLVVARRDRNGGMTTISYDAAGRATTTVRAAGTPEAEVETCDYLPGTRLEQRCTRDGSTTITAYDHDQRVIARTALPRADLPLTTATRRDIWGRVLATTDPYGRSTWLVHDTQDRVIRTVRELLPDGGGIGAALAAWESAQTAPHAWTGLSIREQRGVGSLTLAGDAMSVTGGASTAIWYTSDRCFMAVQPCVGDGILTARVTDLVGGGAGSQAGLMFRADADGSAPYAFVFLKGDDTVAFQWRTYAGQACGLKTVGAGARPQWLQLQRVGSVITARISADGVAWTVVGTATPALGVDAMAGVAVAANTSTAVTATLDHVSLARSAGITATARAAYAQRLVAALPRVGGADPPYIVEETTYDAAGQVVARTDGNGTATTFAYDGCGRLIEQIEAAATMPASTRFGYDVAGNRVSVTTPRGIVTAMAYTGRNLVATVTEDAGTPEAVVVSTRSYTATGKLASETDALGRTTGYAYGICCDRLAAVREPGDFADLATSFTYDGVGNRITVRSPLNQVTATAYDARHRPIRVTNPAGEMTVLVYDDDLTDGVGLDAVDRVAAILPGLGFGPGAGGSAVARTDALGATSYELRDGLGRSVARIDALGYVTRIVYDAIVDGLVETAQTDALGHVTRVRSDGAGRVRQQVDALGHASTAGYDAVGNQLRQRDALGIGWDAIYDARSRLLARTTTRQDTNVTVSWAYDADGNRLAETDAEGKTESATYDRRNRRIALTDRLGGSTRFAYDAVGNLVSISDADNEGAAGGPQAERTTQYAYDARNLLIAEAFPTGQQGRTLRVYGYDAARRLTSRQVGILAGDFGTSPAFGGSPVTTTYAYDAANRLTTRGYGDGLADTFGYDAVGRLLSAASARYATTVDRAYDAAGRLTGESLTLPDGQLVGTTLAPATYTVGSAYHADHTLASQTYPTGSVVTRTYTSRHELATVALDGAAVSSRQYDAAGRLATATAGNGLVETRTYVPGDHLVGSIAVPGVTGFGYTYDADGRKLTEAQAIGGPGQSFAYDAAGRLTGWSAGTATQAWDLSLVGDWRSTTRSGAVETRVHTAVHEATQVGPNLLSYDPQGNLTRDERQTALAWDPENRLLRARITPDASVSGFGSLASYRYDALGRRIATTVDGVTTLYLPAGAQTVVELTRPALPSSQAAIDGAEADGTLADMARTPASGGILPGAGITRVSFQPATTAVPAGFVRDAGRIQAERTNALSYGWSADVTAQAVVRHGAVPLVAYDTHIRLEPGQQWRVALPNGSYPVVLVAGDPLSTQQTNHLRVNGERLADPDPSSPPGYAAGDFDAWARQVTVSDGYLTIAGDVDAVDAKLCFIEIGVAGTALPADIATTLQDLMTRLTNQTGATPEPVEQVREFAYGSYVDEVVAYRQTVGGVVARYYPHYNHLYSVAALTDASGAVVERYSYDAYGKQKITDASGNVTRSKSAVGWDRGFTGYISDSETGLLHARARQYSPTLGRFIGRNQFGEPMIFKYTSHWISRESASLRMFRRKRPAMGYIDGWSMYLGAFAMYQGVDPSGEPVYLQGHPVFGDWWHLSLLLVDENGNTTTIGAGPESGDLVGGTDRERDRRTGDRDDAHRIPVSPPPGVTDEEFRRRIREAMDRYNQNPVPYDLFPEPDGSDGYNSNSFVAGVITAAGGTPPDISNDYPYVPVPPPPVGRGDQRYGRPSTENPPPLVPPRSPPEYPGYDTPLPIDPCAEQRQP